LKNSVDASSWLDSAVNPPVDLPLLLSGKRTSNADAAAALKNVAISATSDVRKGCATTRR
jgi:hypothetical protein